MTNDSTIAAIATPPGIGAISVIRISGSQTRYLAHRLFRPSKKIETLMPRHLYHGDIIEYKTGKVIDEVLVVLMNKPNSYTGEDVLEIYCHGSYVIAQTVMNELIKSGCRMARPGEFTERAYLNERLDLSQAESVHDLITAKTDKDRELALSHLKGKLSETIDAFKEEILGILAMLESSLDFTEDETSSETSCVLPCVAQLLSTVIQKIRHVLESYEQGKIIRYGARIVIVGKPNTGKSSLFNALLGEERVIVTSLPGTTRDFIEELINVREIPIVITDTAGLRTPDNIIEEKGIELVKAKVAGADLIIILLDGSQELMEEDRNIVCQNKKMHHLTVVNKSDLPLKLNLSDLQDIDPETDILSISAKYGKGISELINAIYEKLAIGPIQPEPPVMIANLRHKNALEKTVSFLTEARNGAVSKLPTESIAIEIHDALACIDEILNVKTTEDDVLKNIFSHFCIGK